MVVHGMPLQVAAIGSTMPVLAGQVKGVERKLHARLDAAYGTLDTLGSALAEAAKIQAGSTANPFKGETGVGEGGCEGGGAAFVRLFNRKPRRVRGCARAPTAAADGGGTWEGRRGHG